MLTDEEIEKELPTANPLARAEVETLVAYPASEILVSGWIQKESALAGHGAWLRARFAWTLPTTLLQQEDRRQ